MGPQARKRRKLFVEAVQEQTFGKCPKPPELKNGDLHDDLSESITSFVIGLTDTKPKRVLVGAEDMTKAEIRYCLKVCRELGFDPRWD